MKKRLHVVSVFALILVMVTTTSVFAAAPVPGTGNTDVIVMNTNMNTGDSPASVVAEYVNQSGVVEATKSPAGGVPSLGAAQFAASDSGLADGWNGSVVVSSDREVTAVANTAYTGGSAEDGLTGSSYSGFAEGATEIFIPSAFQRFNAQISRLTVQNMDSGTATISINYYNRDGTAYAGNPITDSIPQGAQRTYDLSQTGAKVPDFPDNLADGWVGSAKITSDKKIGAVASTHWEHFASAYESTPAPATTGASELTCPWVSRRFIAGDWVQSVGVIVQNLFGGAAANITATWKNRDGTTAFSFTHSIPALAAKGYNTRVRADTPDPDALWAALGNDWNGALVITSDQSIGAVVDMNWRRAGEQAANTYRCEDSMSGGSSALAAGSLNLFYTDVNRILTGGSTWQKYTSIVAQNVSTTAASVTVKWYDRTGTLKHTFNDTIPAQTSHGYNTRFVADTPDPASLNAALGNNFIGQVVITSNQPLIGLGTNTYIGGVDTYNAYPK